MAKKQEHQDRPQEFLDPATMNFIKFIVLMAGFIGSYFANKYETRLAIQELKNDIMVTNMRIDYLPGSKPIPKIPTSFNLSAAILPDNNLALIKQRKYARID